MPKLTAAQIKLLTLAATLTTGVQGTCKSRPTINVLERHGLVWAVPGTYVYFATEAGRARLA